MFREMKSVRGRREGGREAKRGETREEEKERMSFREG